MDHNAFDAAMNRARKRLAHAARQYEAAESPRAKARHARRQRNARQRLADAVWTFDRMAYLHEAD